MNTNTDTKEITLKDIQDAKDVLKKLSSKWAKLLAAKMFPTEETETSIDKIYNLTNGRNRDPELRISFLHHSSELKKELSGGHDEARGILNEMKS